MNREQAWWAVYASVVGGIASERFQKEHETRLDGYYPAELDLSRDDLVLAAQAADEAVNFGLSYLDSTNKAR